MILLALLCAAALVGGLWDVVAAPPAATKITFLFVPRATEPPVVATGGFRQSKS